MNPIKTFENALRTVWNSDTPPNIKSASLKKVEEGIHQYVERARKKAGAGRDPLAECARRRAIGYLELLEKDCAYLAEACRDGVPAGAAR